MTRKTPAPDDDLRAECDFEFSTGKGGRHFRRLAKEGANVGVLEPDVAKAFPYSAEV